MRRGTGAVLAVLALLSPAWAGDFEVKNTQDSGTNSLRWAIDQANASPEADRITFATGLTGKTIHLQTLLGVYSSDVTINGDINGDGKPDIFLDGSSLLVGHDGIEVDGDRCTLIGLAIGNCWRFGVMASDVEGFTLRSCHVGVDLSGNGLAKNGDSDVYLQRCTNCTIGGTAAADRNVIAGGSSSPWANGIVVCQSTHCTISGNYLGLKRNGLAKLGAGGVGVVLFQTTPPSTQNTIGGAAAGAGNRFAGLDYGVVATNADRNVIAGNTFGLAADGSSPAPIVMACVQLTQGADHNRIGGTMAAQRNVFGSAGSGVVCEDADTKANTIQGNYFGLNAAGTQVRPLTYGVYVTSGGAQTIGGDTVGAGNYFIPTTSGITGHGVLVQESGSGTLVKGNHFGVKPGGGDIPARFAAGIGTNAAIDIVGNTIASLGTGIDVYGAAATPGILKNTLRKCDKAVAVGGGAKPRLGNLGNASTTDDGGNAFATTNTWHIYNETANGLKAEGNGFGTTIKAAIDAKIWDKLDDGSLGRVDFIPLLHGVIPTATATCATLSLTGATALPTPTGAEIAFTLSAPAAVTVEVLNVAGRSVALITRDRPAEPGRQRLAWTGRSTDGTAAPAGAYVVRITARTVQGGQVAAVVALRLVR